MVPLRSCCDLQDFPHTMNFRTVRSYEVILIRDYKPIIDHTAPLMVTCFM